MPIRRGLPAGAAALALIVLASLPGSTQLSPASPALLIRDVTILSMDDEPTRRGSVLLRGDRIEYVGPTPTLPPTSDLHIVDGRGRFLIPGLIDMHTHVSKTRRSSLSLLVAHGVTTVRDLGGDHEELLAWRREIDAGTRVGPRLLIAGPYLESASNAARQHATPASEMVEPTERTRIGVATPADADRIIAGIAARGVDHLKIRTTTDRETYLAIGAVARRNGLALAGHVQPYSPDDILYLARHRSSTASIACRSRPTQASGGSPEHRFTMTTNCSASAGHIEEPGRARYSQGQAQDRQLRRSQTADT